MTAANITIQEFLKSRPARKPQGPPLVVAAIVAPLAAMGLRASGRCSRPSDTVAAGLAASRSTCRDRL